MSDRNDTLVREMVALLPEATIEKWRSDCRACEARAAMKVSARTGIDVQKLLRRAGSPYVIKG